MTREGPEGDKPVDDAANAPSAEFQPQSSGEFPEDSEFVSPIELSAEDGSPEPGGSAASGSEAASKSDLEEVEPIELAEAPRSGPRFGLILLLLVIANGIVFALIYFTSSEATGEDRAVAGRFMDGLVFGSSVAPDGEITGYAMAHDLLSADCRRVWDFARFSEFFDLRTAEYGYTDSWIPHGEEGGNVKGRILRYRVDYAGDREPAQSFLCELLLVPEDGTHRVASWNFKPLDEDGR